MSVLSPQQSHSASTMQRPQDISHVDQTKLLMKRSSEKCTTKPLPLDPRYSMEDNLLLSPSLFVSNL